MLEPNLQQEKKILTFNIFLEQNVLGALLKNNDLFDAIAEYLSPDVFFHPACKIVYKWIYEALMEGHPVNTLTLAHIADTDSTIKNEGGAKFLAKLQDLPISYKTIPHYTKILYDLHLKRSALDMAENIVEEVKSIADLSGEDLLLQAENQVYTLLKAGPSSARMWAFNQLATNTVKELQEYVKSGKKILGTSSGLQSLDNLTGGFYPSDFVIVAGRPGMGKTALALNFAYNAAKFASEESTSKKSLGQKVLMFSLEMSAEQLTRRILSLHTSIKSTKLRTAQLTQQDIVILQNSLKSLNTLPLFIDDTPNMTVDKLRLISKRLQRQENIGMIIIDYLQLMVSHNYYKNHNRVEEITDITRNLKILAKELNVPVIALSQLSRGVEARDDKRPQLSDLRDSGSIEQDADMVMFLYRPAYYMKKPEKKSAESNESYDKRMNDYIIDIQKIEHVAQLIIEKQRHGPVGSIDLSFTQDHMRFYDIDNRWDDEGAH